MRRVGATLHCSAQASHCGGFSRCGARALGVQASVVVAHGLSCFTCMWDLPGPGLEPVSAALAGGFLTTVPPGKPGRIFLDFKSQGSETAQRKEEWIPSSVISTVLELCARQCTEQDSQDSEVCLQGLLV